MTDLCDARRACSIRILASAVNPNNNINNNSNINNNNNKYQQPSIQDGHQGYMSFHLFLMVLITLIQLFFLLLILNHQLLLNLHMYLHY